MSSETLINDQFRSEMATRIRDQTTTMIASWEQSEPVHAVNAAEYWLEQTKGVSAELRKEGAAFGTEPQHVDRIVKLFEEQRDRVVAWLAKATELSVQRCKAAKQRDLLATMPAVKQFIDKAPALFDPDDEKDFPTFFAFDDRMHLTVIEGLGLNKQQMADAVKGFASKADVVALVMICEMWVGHQTKPLPPQLMGSISIADVDRCKELGIERHEAFAVQVETAAGVQMWQWMIETDPAGVRRLGPRMDAGASGRGRFHGLIKPQPGLVN